jgi:hypothetical protein
MRRQRLRDRSSRWLAAGRVVTLVFAVLLIWYGLMLLLLALDVSSATVDSLSGYRTAFDWLAGLTPADVDGTTTRAVLAAGGLVAFVVFGYLAIAQLPRPYLARRDLELATDQRGEVTVEPRAVERLAELAAAADPAVTATRARYSSDDLTVDVSVRRARDLPDVLRGAQQRVAAALDQHELPPMPVNVTLTGYDRRNRRELQ